MQRSQLIRASLTFMVGGVGVLLFLALGLPLPWLLGPLAATMLASLAGAPVEIRPGLRKYLIVILGVMLGGTFSPEGISRAGEWVPSLIASVGYLLLVALVAQLYCRVVLKMDNVTAIFSGMPGGLSEMLILGEEYGADVKTMTLTHVTRVTSVLFVIPFFLTYWVGLEGHPPPPPEVTWSWRDLGILATAALLGLFVGRGVRMPAYALTGPMLFSTVVHLMGVVVSEPPPLVSLIVQLAMGSALGARFYGVALARVGKIMFLAFGMAVAMMAVTLASAALLSLFTGISFEALILALSPGGFAEMALAALMLNIDPAFVTTHHGLRLLIVVFIVPIGLSLWAKRNRE